MILIVNNYLKPGADYLGYHTLKDTFSTVLKEQFDTESVIVHFSEIDSLYLEKHPEITGVILSGSGDDWTTQYLDVYEGEWEMIRTAHVPILGVCAGHQLIALAFGGRIDRCPYGQEERGMIAVERLAADPLLEGLSPECVMSFYHMMEVSQLPAEFKNLGKTRKCKCQILAHHEKPIYGVQFHPELFTPEYTDGLQLLGNFIEMCKT